MGHEIKHWLALGKVRGLGALTYKALIDAFGKPEIVFETSAKRLGEIPGVGKKLAAAIKGFKEWQWVEKEISSIKRHAVTFLTLTDEDYPKALFSIPDPPPYLYVKGMLRQHDAVAVAVVGTRIPTPYGISATEKISGELAASGVTIISGMARGIDSAAHRGAIAAGGRTMAVLGSGVDVVYPPENKKLYGEIISRGAVVSEFPMGTPPFAANFPQRNRIISGLATGVLVAEASLRSGSLITAQLALDYGRDVFALPGSVTSLNSKGTNKLIKDGAKLIEGAHDILEELPTVQAACRRNAENKTPQKVLLSSDEEKVIGLLGEPCFIDSIIQKTGLSAHRVSALLLNMELKGLIQQQPGKQFIRRI